ncbi:cytochrome P450, family 77, subfamily A, polypeptide 4 [Hibiscus trionum]|uniref:Cytochrome P450, family 77, subfamily A, polypeptide 4 n=1 Tax=Hibiscus trionum TaxID=183268 RepID=A0A9W7GY26_HIBTR|nr:cytochrome P450, family 77, subfamily A, polypeptide 4 [Hibiscus trionum]
MAAFNSLPFFFTVAAFFLACLLLSRSRKSRTKRLKVPPGPPGWPVVGNLFQAARSGKPFFQYVDDLRQKYGPIFTLRMGTRTMIILSDAILCHEAFIEKGAIFASRPRENPTRSIFSCNKFTVNAAIYGPEWRSLRRNMVQNMLSSSRIKEFVGTRRQAMDKLIDRLRAEGEGNGGVVSVLKNARFAVFCILLGMCFGIEMDEETVEKMDQTMKSVLIALDPRIDDYLPILRPFFAKQRKRALQVRKQQIENIVPFIQQRRAALRDPGSDKSAMTFSYLDTLFDLKVEGRNSEPSDSELVSLCSEFINGGTDTTATAVEWGIAQLIQNPDVQSKLVDEIKWIVGDRTVEEKDVEKMKYLQAIVKELLRKHPPTYFSLTHAATEPATLGGFDIPIDANVETFLPGISEDPKIWSNPEKFDPDRFYLGKVDADITGVTMVKMMPFGAGRRICPGLTMATVHIHLMLARMVQEFEWTAYPPNSTIDFTGKFEFTVVMKNTLKAIIKPRS